MEKNKNIKYINSYDGIRAIAVFGVLFFHMIPDRVPGGFLGVVVFLVMAGFLSMKKVMEEDRYSKSYSFFEYMKKRVKKLLPLLAFFILSVNLFLYLFMSQYLPKARYQAISGLFFVNNIAQIMHGESYFETIGYVKPFTHLWALSLEMQLYIVFYLIVAGRYKRENKKRFKILFFTLTLISFFLMAGIYLQTEDVTRIYYMIDTRMFSFFMGALAALYTIDDRKKMSYYSKNSSFVGFLIIVFMILSFIYLSSDKAMYIYQMFTFSVITAILLVISVNNGSYLSKFLNLLPLKYIGKRGYPIYLWHYPVIKISQKIFAYSEINHLFFAFMQILFSIVISEISYQIFMKNIFKEKRLKTVLTIFMCVLVIVFPYRAHGQGLKELEELDLMKEKIQKSQHINSLKTTTEPNLKVEKKEKTTTDSQLKVEKKEDKKPKTEDKQTVSSENKTPPKVDKKPQIDYQNLKKVEDMIAKFSEVYPEAKLSLEDYKKYKDTKVSLVGDSVGDMAAPYLKQFLPNITIDAKVSRQMYKAYEPYKNMKNSGNMGKVLILELGTNGNFQPSYAEKIIEDAKVPVVLVSINIPEQVEGAINKNLYALEKKYKNVYLADWHKYCKSQKDLFYSDATHPNDKGSKVYAYLVTQKVIEALKIS